MTPNPRIAAHQAEAEAMQLLAQPVTEVPLVLIVGMRLAQLDFVHERDWQEFKTEADVIYEAARAALVGQLAACIDKTEDKS